MDKKEKPPIQWIAVQFTDEQKRKLKTLAAMRGVTMAKLVAEALTPLITEVPDETAH